MIQCPKCGIGELSLKTAATEKNKGKKFYSCSDREGCNYFKWEEEDKGYLRKPIENNPIPSKKGLEYIQGKDKRISWLSVFSSLCNLKQGSNSDTKEVELEAYAIVDRIYKDYPLPSDEPF